MKTIAILEDHTLFAEALEAALTLDRHDVHQVPLLNRNVSSSHLLAAIMSLEPHLVLLDIDLGAAGSGTRLLTPLTRAGVPVIVVTGSLEVAQWGECVCFGADTVLPKTSSLHTILSTIRLAVDGLPVLDEDVREHWILTYQMDRNPVRATRNRLNHLTPREGEVLAHLMSGHHVRNIAERSEVSEATVRTQVKSILVKLEVPSQVAAVGAAFAARWTPPILEEP